MPIPSSLKTVDLTLAFLMLVELSNIWYAGLVKRLRQEVSIVPSNTFWPCSYITSAIDLAQDSVAKSCLSGFLITTPWARKISIFVESSPKNCCCLRLVSYSYYRHAAIGIVIFVRRAMSNIKYSTSFNEYFWLSGNRWSLFFDCDEKPVDNEAIHL